MVTVSLMNFTAVLRHVRCILFAAIRPYRGSTPRRYPFEPPTAPFSNITAFLPLDDRRHQRNGLLRTPSLPSFRRGGLACCEPHSSSSHGRRIG